MWKFSNALRQKTYLHYTTEEEREAIQKRFSKEGLDEQLPDDKKLPHVWRWLSDAESNCLSLRKQNEKLHKQQEADLKEVEEYIENLWKINNERLFQLETENRLLKFELENVKIDKKYNVNNLSKLNILNNTISNVNYNFKLNESNNKLNNFKDLSFNNQIYKRSIYLNTGKENKNSSFNNIKQVFTKNNFNTKFKNKTQDQLIYLNKQGNLDKEIRFLIGKFQQIEIEKKLLETENENLIFKLNETLNVCEQLEKSKTNTQLAKTSKSLYELRKSTSEYRLDLINPNKKLINQIPNSRTIFNLNEKKNFNKLNEFNEKQISNLNNNLNQVNNNNTVDCGSIIKSKSNEENELGLMEAVRKECTILKNELIIKEKLLSDLQNKYDTRKVRYKEQMLRLRDHIERETKRWENLFQTANQKRLEAENELFTIKQN